MTAEVALEPRHLELPGFLHDFLQVRARLLVADNGGVDDAGDRPGGAGALVEGLGIVLLPNQVREALEELTDVDRRAVEEEKAFGEDADGQEGTGEQEPHQGAALAEEVDHGRW